ncbi:MAG: zinc/cadmium/mercury/lead-transporting ATPase [Firmicutes bacterium ADurb.Bin193]|nr:MAG: zinc/cadmium/mercury/lead-transporting ATPase [Firmicutes bacterium ADurb.Bin193]
MAEKKVSFKIGNMTCVSCEMRIENTVCALNGVRSVKASYNTGIVKVKYDSDIIKTKSIREVIEKLHYKIIDNAIGTPKSLNANPPKKKVDSPIGMVLIIVALYLILNRFGFLNIIPEVDASMGYFALFVVGLITSLHCTAMCGGINISQCMTYKQKNGKENALLPSFLYNAGRVTSYTVVGGIVGAVGSVISFSGYAKGLIALIAGIFMVIMGLNMLNIFPWLKKLTPRMPKIFGNKIHSKNSYGPYVVGLLNGLMPCGPLQAMQIYALGTGSAIAGAVSMFMFSLGTVPLMFGLGAVSSFLKGRFTEKMLKVGAVLVVVLGVGMFNNGMALSGIALPLNLSSASENIGSGQQTKASGTKKYVNPATVKGNVQEITTQLGRNYTPITVQKGIPVKWTIQAQKPYLNGCSNEMQIPKFNKNYKLKPGDNLIEFTPTETGTIPYSCWMGMLRSTITVVDDLGNITIDDSAVDNNTNAVTATPSVPTDEIAVSEIEDGTQYVKINMDNERFSPAVVVMQKGVPTKWVIDGKIINSGNSVLLFPAYYAQIPMKKGENPIDFIPEIDFDFSASDNSFYGYVKVVDDIKKIDIAAIKEEVKNYIPSGEAFGGGYGGASCH